MSWLLLSMLAWADPWIDAGVGGRLPLAGEIGGGAAVTAGGGVGLTSWLRGEGRVLGLVRADGGATLEAGPSVRAFVVDPARERAWRPSLHVDGGWAGGVGPGPRIGGGLAVDLPGSRTSWARVGARGRTDVQGGWSVGLHLGIVGRPWAPAPEAVAAAPPRLAEAPPPIPPPVGDRWWDPEACDWVDTEGPGTWRPEDGVRAPGGGAEGLEGGGPLGEADDAQGWLMVVAAPGDVVRLGGLAQTVGPDGVARLRAAEGVVEVTVVGGGREQAIEAAIADGYALWLRARPPEEVRVGFGVGSATVLAGDRVLVQALARNRGQYALRISGSYSPEGDRASNLRLAADRAAAVVDLLREAGVPAEDLRVEPPTPPRPGLSAAEQRAVFVQPVQREEAP